MDRDTLLLCTELSRVNRELASFCARLMNDEADGQHVRHMALRLHHVSADLIGRAYRMDGHEIDIETHVVIDLPVSPGTSDGRADDGRR